MEIDEDLEIAIGYVLGTIDILRMDCVNFTLKSRNKLADNLEILLKKYDELKLINKKQEKDIKKLFNIKLYACDTNKNKECEKKYCYMNGGDCDATTDKTKVKFIDINDYISKKEILNLSNKYEEALENETLTKINQFNLLRIVINDLDELIEGEENE